MQITIYNYYIIILYAVDYVYLYYNSRGVFCHYWTLSITDPEYQAGYVDA